MIESCCEWAYVIDLDKSTFEIYHGSNKDKIVDGRFKSGDGMTEETYLIVLFATAGIGVTACVIVTLQANRIYRKLVRILDDIKVIKVIKEREYSNANKAGEQGQVSKELEAD